MGAMCVECSKPPIKHFRRRLCESCYWWIVRHGDIEDYPRQNRKSWEVVEDYQFIKSQDGGDLKSIAHRLGVTPDALRLALKRQAASV